MKYFRLIWKNVWRKKIRTSLTILSVFVAFLLFALLSAIGFAFRGGVDVADAERLIVIHKISLINPLPMSYMNRIASTEGVASVTHASWFGGYYQESAKSIRAISGGPAVILRHVPGVPHVSGSNSRHSSAIEPVPWLDRNLLRNSGGRSATGFRSRRRSGPEPMVAAPGNSISRASSPPMIRAAARPSCCSSTTYFDEARAFGKGTAGWYELRVAKGADPVQVANAIDLQFANSPNETKTSTEAAFAQSFMKQYGNIALIVTLILGAVFFTLLLVSGNTMSQSVRERISELAVLKTIGFTTDPCSASCFQSPYLSC